MQQETGSSSVFFLNVISLLETVSYLSLSIAVSPGLRDCIPLHEPGLNLSTPGALLLTFQQIILDPGVVNLLNVPLQFAPFLHVTGLKSI